MAKTLLKLFAITTSVVMLSFYFVFQGDSGSKAFAANGADFNPGNIISDAVFFDGTALNAGQIQSFLESQVPVCQIGYTCLKDYRQSTPTRSEVPGLCAQYPGASNERASEIIAKVGQACGISQKVLLVLLQKEQILVTDDWPVDVQYRSATGYGCPDTAACDSQYYGFFNQVYNAAKQFKNYAANPNGWNYVAGRVNTVLFNPNRACGTSDIYIANQATAGLYIYTPYQPNSAALANLYGYGDGCSAYGNRNFWRIFTDWFGNPASTALVRTIQNPTVYLLASGVKYPIASLALLGSYSPLGVVSFVSQGYIDTIPTAQNASKIIREPSGGIYYIDDGSKYRFTSCSLVISFGGSCSANGYTQLDGAQANAFRTASDLTQVIANTSGLRFYISGGAKNEILNPASQINAGWGNIATTSLSNSALSEMPWASLVGPTGIFVKSKSSPSVFYITPNNWMPVNSWDALVAVANNPNPQISLVSNEAISNAPRGATLSSPFTAGIALSGAWAPGSFIKAPGSPTVFQVAATEIRAVSTWDALVYAAGTTSPTINTVPAALIAASPVGSPITEPVSSAQGTGPSGWQVGSFVKTSSSPSVYVVTTEDIRLITNWDVLVAIANSTRPIIATVSANSIDSATKGNSVNNPINAGVSLAGAWAPGNFVKSAVSSTVYQVSNSNIRPISSWNSLLRVAGTNNPQIFTVPSNLLSNCPIGLEIQ